MSCNRLQAILVREHRGFVADHIAFAIALAVLGVVFAVLTR
jgi:hypothetical protein